MSSQLYSHRFAALGGQNEIKFFAADRDRAEHALNSIVKEIARIESKFSRYLSDSIISQVNAAAGQHAVTLDSETAELVGYSDTFYKQSEGLFDITSGILRRVWDFNSRQLPSQQQIEELLPLVGWNQVEWSSSSIYLPKAGMQIDFGGIGKEYAADRAADILLKSGVSNGFVNLAGDVRVVGPRIDGRAWRIGIRDPREASKVAAFILLSSGALATSGDYERYMEIDGNRYCHILNPKTGWPVTGVSSASVLAPLCLVAGSAATLTMLLGPLRGKQFLEQSGASYLLITEQGKYSKAIEFADAEL